MVQNRNGCACCVTPSSLLGVTGSDWRVGRVEVGVSRVPLIVGNTLTGVALVVNGTGDVSCVFL